MDNKNILKQIPQLAPWHLDIDLGNGIITSMGNQQHYEDETKNRISLVDPNEKRT